MPTDEQIEAIIKVAEQCPANGSTPLDEVPAVNDLSRLLVETGFPGLSRAVLHASRWIQVIAASGDAQRLQAEEVQAAMPGWTWNDLGTESEPAV